MPPSRLHALFQDQLANGRALVQLLESEAQALSLRDVDAIEGHTAEKQRLAGALAELARSVTELLPQQDPSELNSSIDNDPALKALWEETKSVLATAHALNQANGKTVGLSLNHVTRTLRVLTTGSDKPPNSVYSASGKVDAGAKRSRRVVKV